jgi:cobalt-precorrin 5A hydrolase
MRVAGFGFRSAATVASLQDALRLAGGAADRLATAPDKAATPVFRAFAEAMQLPVLAVARERLADRPTVTQSARVAERFGAGSLAEAAALAGAGPGARLLGPRVVSGDGLATAAIAERMDE